MIILGKVFPFKRKIAQIFEQAGEVLKEDFFCVSVSVNFVDEKEIRQLNKRFRDVDAVTDVLSFPNLEKAPEQKLSEFDKEKVDGMLFLGDVVICKKRARQQARDFGHGLKREVCFLALHGLLHLMGFDHITEEDERNMMDLAEKILQKCGVAR